MTCKATGVFALALLVLYVTVLTNKSRAQRPDALSPIVVPKAWDDEALRTMDVPLVEPGASPVHISADFYYRIPERKIYKSYPIYAPGKEPPGYLEWLKQQEPEVAFDPSKLKTEEDWIKAGELVFEAPIILDALVTVGDVRDPAWYERNGVPVARDGVMPFNRYQIRKRGELHVGDFSCATCHSRVMADRTVIKGAQGNFPLGSLDGNDIKKSAGAAKDSQQYLERTRAGSLRVYATPWLRPDPNERIKQMSIEEIASAHAAVPPGVQPRFGTSLFYPVQVPDLIGIKERRYLDRTGHVRHRTIEDLMRYASLNQGIFFLDRYGDYSPTQKLPDPGVMLRYSDEQLYALAQYLYSLKPPPNPNKFDKEAARGEKIFQREGCNVCHTPPLYTNNKLTPAEGFKVPEEDMKRFEILNTSVGTDSGLAMKTRRGTGYYKVPSLKGVWYRGPFEHSGSVATLEEWFDAKRTREDYVPGGYKGYGVERRAVRGHRFGLNLSSDDRKALIAFLRSL